jgi:hypothetical protein
MFDHTKIDFEVEKFSLLQVMEDWDDAGFDKLSKVPKDIGVGLRRKDTKQVLGIVSDNYSITQYDEIVNGVEEALALAQVDTTDAEFTTEVHDGGAKLELRAKFPAHAMSMRDGSDVVEPEFCFRSSHNGTWANNGMMGLWRHSCFNTLVSGDKLAYVYGRHTKNFNVPAFASKIQKAGEFISGTGLDRMRDWYDTTITRDEAINLFTKTLAVRTNNVSRKKEHNKVMLSNLMKIFDEENRHLHGKGLYEGYSERNKGTLWSAYNAATYWSSHPNSKRGADHNVKVNREDRVRKMLHSNEWIGLETKSMALAA